MLKKAKISEISGLIFGRKLISSNSGITIFFISSQYTLKIINKLIALCFGNHFMYPVERLYLEIIAIPLWYLWFKTTNPALRHSNIIIFQLNLSNSIYLTNLKKSYRGTKIRTTRCYKKFVKYITNFK